MNLNTQQIGTLKDAVLASPDQAVQAAAANRNDTELALLLNLPSTFSVWRWDVPTSELVGAVVLANFTPLDAPDDTLLYANRCHVCELKQNNIRMLLSRDLITAQKASTRKDLADALTNVPAGVGGAAIDAGWLGNGKVKATITRFATVAEKVFATGTGSVGVPGDLGVQDGAAIQGDVTIDDIGRMWRP